MIKVFDIVPKHVLISRETIRELLPALVAAQYEEQPSTIDFDGVQAVAPSVIDELLLLLSQVGKSEEVEFAHIPAEPSSKYFAVARAHGMELTIAPGGTWKLRRHRKAPHLQEA